MRSGFGFCNPNHAAALACALIPFCFGWRDSLRLAAANPSGTGFGNSGELATAFLLPDGIAVRTLVNSHLTLLVEFGWLAGGIWCMFLLLALHSAVRYPRMGLSFLGLVLSAFASSLFDWHVLFRSSRTADLPLLNFILSRCVFAIFVAECSFLAAKSVPKIAGPPAHPWRRRGNLT